MATILLIVIYLSFIALGLPDSLFGTAWPAIYTEFTLPFSIASATTIISSVCSIFASIMSARVIARFGTGKVTAFSTALTSVALLIHCISGNFWALCLLAIPLGLGAGAVDTGLNNYVALHYTSAQMNLLHCFFGIGISVSPYIMSLYIDSAAGWRGGYLLASLIQSGITLILFVSLPLWKKVKHTATQEEAPIKVLSLKQIARIPGVKIMWLLFLTTCAIEYTAGSWGSTYLVEHRLLTAEHAAQIVLFYYIGMTTGRLLSSFLAIKLSCWQIIRVGLITLCIAVIVLLFPVPDWTVAAALFMIGLGNGPMFPNFTYLAPINFGADVSQSIIGTQMAASSIGIMVIPTICGLLGQAFGMGVFPIYLTFMTGVLILGYMALQHIIKNR